MIVLIYFSFLIYQVGSFSQNTKEVTICPSFNDYNTKESNPKCHTEPIGSIEDWVKEENCTIETYNVTTKDRYILTLHHMYCGEIFGTYPILFGHGMISNESIILIGKDKSPGFTIFKTGYEFWTINFRGTSSSRHLSLDKNDTRFWDFSWHEMGVYDYPAAIEFIRNFDKKKYGSSRKIVLMGLSMGSAALSVFATELPDYAIQVSIHHLHIGPTHYYLRTRPLISTMSTIWPVIKVLLKSIFKSGEASTSSPKLVNLWLQNMYTMRIYQTLFALLVGSNLEAIDPEVYPFWVIHSRDTFSVQSVIHFYQNIASRGFAKYNYGLIKNLVIYNSPTPTKYNVSNINVNTTYFTAKNEGGGYIQDIEDFYNALPKSVQAGLHIMEDEKFCHEDFIAYSKHSLSQFTLAHLLPVLKTINPLM